MKKYITTHEELLKLDGKKVTCKIEEAKITDAKIRVENGRVAICQNVKNGYAFDDKLGYEYSWVVSNDKDIYLMPRTNNLYENNDHLVTNIALVGKKTLADLEVGDTVVDPDGYYKKVLGICGEVYFLSYSSNDIYSDKLKKSSSSYTLYELETCGHKLYELESNPEITTIDGKTYETTDELKNVVSKLKEIKK